MRTVRHGDGLEENPDPVVRAAQIMLVHHGYRDLFTTDDELAPTVCSEMGRRRQPSDSKKGPVLK